MLIITQNKTLGLARDMVSRMPLEGRELLSYEIEALGFLARKLAESGLWNKMIVLYPFVGRTAITHSLNLINSTNNISWGSGVSHNASGSTGSGVAANTGVGTIPVLNTGHYNISSLGMSMGIYVPSNASSTNRIEFGGYSGSGSNYQYIAVNYLNLFRGGIGPTNVEFAPTVKTKSFFTIGRLNATYLYAAQDGALRATQTTSNPISGTIGFRIFGGHQNNLYNSSKTIALAFIGNYINPDESYQLSQINLIFQGILLNR